MKIRILILVFGAITLSAPLFAEQPKTTWTAVTNPVISSNGFLSVTLPIAGTRFHRLQWP